MARRYVRDAKGRFAPKGYSGQTGGRGARLKSPGSKRAGGGKRENLIGAKDQTMTSLPKGTIGRTQKLRNRSKMDMGGQRFAKYEAAKKAARLEISRKKQEAWLSATQKKLDAAPLAKTAAKRASRQGGDTAVSNIPMRGRRGRNLDAEISRNVRQQRASARTQDRARNRQFKSDQSRAKALRAKYGDQLARSYAAKSGQSVGEVKRTIKGMAPSRQVQLLTQAGREQRAVANQRRTMAAQPAPGSRRLSKAQVRSQLRADTAVEIYNARGSRRQQIIRNQAGLARTPRAQNNQMRTRADRLAEATATGLPMIKVTKPTRRKLK